eukprot:Pompholyxophrys_sp_v1_NODE_279_length_872_cov_3.537332.p1 type:complete len:245 gc:universal NODE_279_length_872_cov_3.537332:785-51(-)
MSSSLFSSHYGSEQLIILRVFGEFVNFDASRLFKRCGYSCSGTFNPKTNHDLFLEDVEISKQGCFLLGKCPVLKSLFRRGERMSFLAFLGVDGIFECFQTSGTFDRVLFFECIQNLVNSGKVQKYPGRRSVWLIDGAAIHVDAAITEYMRGMGLFLIFLPAYCPFYTAVEIVFGLIKRRCRALYSPSHYGSEQLIMLRVFGEFVNFDASQLFKRCGYSCSGTFNPNTNHDLFLEDVEISLPLEN